MADGVAEHDGARAAANGGGVKTLDGVRVGANRVFRHVHGRKAVLDCELHGFFGGALEMIDGPVFDQPPDGARAQKCGSFNRHSHALGNFGDGANVGFDRSRGAVRFDLHALGDDFAGEGFGVLDGARAGTGQSDVERIDAQRFHQVQDFDFFFDAGIVYARILQAVAKRFIVQQDARAGSDERCCSQVPVVNPFVLPRRVILLHRARSLSNLTGRTGCFPACVAKF